MLALLDDPAVMRFAARRATGWRQQGSAVVLELEGVREPDATGIAAVLAGARLNDAVDRAELTVAVLESGAVRLQVGTAADGTPGLLDEDDLAPAPVGVTTGEGTLRLASERHGGYGPDPEDLTIEITLDPLGLAVLDAGGHPVVRLASEPPVEADRAGVAPFAWMRWTDADGQPRRAITVSLALEPQERLFGLGQRSGPLNLVGSTQTIRSATFSAPVDAARARPPFLLSSRGYGLLVHTAAGLTAELGVRSQTAYTLAVEEPALDVLLLPSTWPRTALAGYARLTGREEAPEPASFGVPEDAAITPPATLEAMRERLREGLTYGLATPGFWRADSASGSGPPAATASPALRTRWAQLALFSPLVGVDSGPVQDPPTSDEAVQDIVQSYGRLRQRLLPYLLHCARETAQSGLPMLRPMLLEFSWDPDAVDLDDQFLLGRDLLVAPIFSDSLEPVTRRVYLPAYANWYDWWTGTLHEGKQWIETTAPLDRVPLYVRAGTAIPLADPHPDAGADLGDVARLLLFAPRDGAIGASVELADDDMLGVEQERGERKARIFIEGIPKTIRELQIVGLPSSAHLVDASAPSIALVPGDDDLPGLGGRWDSLTIRLDSGAFTAGLELAW